MTEFNLVATIAERGMLTEKLIKLKSYKTFEEACKEGDVMWLALQGSIDANQESEYGFYHIDEVAKDKIQKRYFRRIWGSWMADRRDKFLGK